MKRIEPGDVFGMLTIVEKSGSDNGAIWLCKCQCGNTTTARTGALNRTKRLGRVSSCGCYHYLKKQNEDGLFRCSKCLEFLPADQFSRNARTACGLTSTCKSCSKAYREINKDKILHRKREYHHRTKVANKEKRKAYRDRTREASNARCAKWRKSNPDRRREIANGWVRRNKPYGAYRATLRRSMMRQATPPWFENEKVKVLYEKASALGMEVDHVVPLKSDIVCGLHCWDNLQLLVKDENLRKSNKIWPDMP